MKKLIATTLTLLSLSASARQPVNIVWPFAIGAPMANSLRLIAEEANREQNTYTFYVETRPGAGGTIAAKYVLDYKGLALLAGSSSYFTRPQFYPDDSYNIADFTPVYIQCAGQPFVIVSSKYHNLYEIQQQKSLTIGVSMGSLTEANARELQTLLPDSKLTFIGYQNSLQPTQEMIAGDLDLNVDLPALLEQWVDAGKVNVIGASGTTQYKKLPTWYSQGHKGFANLVSNYQLVAPAKTDPRTVRELHKIISQAAKNTPAVAELYTRDRCTRVELDFDQTGKTYNHWVKFWPEKLAKLKQSSKEF
jgi:tripartite-type tricarboxylate transporter receptor subunit TctC